MKKILLVFALFFFLSGCAPEEKSPPQKTTQQPVQRVDILALGDFMLHHPQLRAAEKNGGYDFKPIFRYLTPYIQEADIAMINLETTLTDGSKGYTTYPVFSSPKEVARDFKDVGFDIISTANNHSYDKVMDGVESTYHYLKEAGLDVMGTQIEDTPPLIKEVNGIKLGFICYTYGLNGFDNLLKNSDKPFAVSIFSEEKAENDIRYLKEKGVDAIICYIHWGEEYRKEPTDLQRAQAHFLAEHGVALILGSHPHVPQGVDNVVTKDGKTFVAYSMGNFVSNQRREYMNRRDVETGQMVRASIVKDDKGTRVESFEPLALYVDKYTAGGLHFEVIPVVYALTGEMPVERIDNIRGRLEEAEREHEKRIDPNLVIQMKKERNEHEEK